MEPPTLISFRYSDLPADLALIIFEYAAQPTFAQYAPYTNDPYSSALSLCQVSKIVRRTVLPELLHTVSLSEAHHLLAFVQALRMQKKYIDQQDDLAFDYAPCVHRVSIGEFRGAVRDPAVPFFPPSMAKLDWEFDISLLAPVVLGVSSLAINIDSIDLLLKCLKNACNSDVDLDVDHNNSTLPWSTRSLTLSGYVTHSWWPFVDSNHGHAFLASIQHLTLLFATSFEKCLPFQCNCVSEIQYRGSAPDRLLLYVARAPFKGLETFSLAIPHINAPVAQCGLENIWVKLVTFPASVLSDSCTPEEIESFMGAEFFPRFPFPLLRYLAEALRPH